ncbi:hypothetical protein V757_11160 [Pelistega indica]|uniref:Uncharacterized protein n=1 Tax=Pelistega indica TaxID=1414851 RepID=V8FTT6_9BURK|nr:hypothetical protein [Pelistega indica]ETD67540.1 hypothetical protein V757_11160 [Pelistega indica]
MAVKQFVTPDNLFTDHFELDAVAKKIKVKFPEQQQLPAGVATSLAYDAATQSLTYTEDGQQKSIDLSALALDKYVETVSSDGTDLILTMKDGTQLKTGISTLIAHTHTLDVELQDAFGTQIGFASSIATLSVA